MRHPEEQHPNGRHRHSEAQHPSGAEESLILRSFGPSGLRMTKRVLLRMTYVRLFLRMSPIFLLLFLVVSSPALAADDELRLAYEENAREAIANSDFEAARDFAKQAIDTLDNPDNIKGWEAQSLLADAYEGLGQKEEFLDQIKWLTKYSKSQQTKDVLAKRKQKFLRKYAPI